MAGAPEVAKVRVVRNFLQHEFPTCSLYDFYEPQRSAQVFQLLTSVGSLAHEVAVTDEFFAKQSETAISLFFEQHALGRVLREAGPVDVLVLSGGLRIERR